MNNPLVSIIIPSYNRVNLIEETLQSILDQTYQNWECVIVDDGSTDETEKIIKNISIRDKRIQFFKRPNNRVKGANSCRNYGFEISKGTYINWFDTDDIMHPNFIKSKINCFLKATDINCVISKTIFFRDNINNTLGKEERTYKTNNMLEDFISLKCSWYTWDGMWKKEFLTGKQLFSETLLKGQDRDFHIKMLMKKDLNIDVLNDYLVYYRQHENTISNNFSRQTALSIYNRDKERFIELKIYGVSTNTLMILHIDICKNYRYLKSKEIDILCFILKNPLKKIAYFKWVTKFLLAIIFYKLIGKGYSLLK